MTWPPTVIPSREGAKTSPIPIAIEGPSPIDETLEFFGPPQFRTPWLRKVLTEGPADVFYVSGWPDRDWDSDWPDESYSDWSDGSSIDWTTIPIICYCTIDPVDSTPFPWERTFAFDHIAIIDPMMRTTAVVTGPSTSLSAVLETDLAALVADQTGGRDAIDLSLDNGLSTAADIISAGLDAGLSAAK